MIMASLSELMLPYCREGPNVNGGDVSSRTFEIPSLPASGQWFHRHSELIFSRSILQEKPIAYNDDQYRPDDMESFRAGGSSL